MITLFPFLSIVVAEELPVLLSLKQQLSQNPLTKFLSLTSERSLTTSFCVPLVIVASSSRVAIHPL